MSQSRDRISSISPKERAEYERTRPPRQLVHTTFTVTGKGAFPLDMLFYESCVPASEADAQSMRDALEVAVEITLIHPGARSWQPTAGRWESHGWTVVPDRVKQADYRI